MKKLIFILAISVAGCNNGGHNETYKYDSAVFVQENMEGQEEKSASLSKEECEKIFDSLKNNFLIQTDDFNKVSWYTHKSFGKYWPNRKTIYSEVRDDGFINLMSNYYSTDWIFHTWVQIKVGEEIIETPEVKSYSEDNRNDNKNGMIWENIRYDKRLAQKVLSKISDSTNNKITVRFQGSKFYNDAVISKSDKIALKESFLLSKALQGL